MIELSSSVIALADAGFYPVRLHYPIFTEETVLCSCGRPECPESSRGKHPVATNWGRSASRDPEVIRQQFSGRPWNVGIIIGPCHGIPEQDAIIDIEDDSPDGRALADQLLSEFPSPSYSSGKSIHRLYRWTPDLPPVANMTVQGLEFRFGGHGKETQSVAPPSKHNSGRDYEWLPGRSPADLPIVPLPGHLVAYLQEEYARIEEKKGSHSGTSNVAFKRPGKKVAPGGRHHALLRHANHLWRLAYNLWGFNSLEEQEVIDQVWMWLAGANLMTCDPPKTEKEVEVIFSSSAAFMRSELAKEMEEAEKYEDPQEDPTFDDSQSFMSYLKRNGIRLRHDPTMDPTVEDPERIDEWTCDWSVEIVAKADEPTIRVIIGDVVSEMPLADFDRPVQMAYRMQSDSNGSIVLNRTFAFWCWELIWKGRKNDSKGKKGITRGLREHLLSKATVIEKSGLTLCDQVEEIIFSLSGPLDPLLNALQEYNAEYSTQFSGRLKLTNNQLVMVRLPEDPLTGWYSDKDGVALYCKVDEICKKYRSAFGSGVTNGRIAQSLEELGFEKSRFRSGSMEGRWFVRNIRKNVE